MKTKIFILIFSLGILSCEKDEDFLRESPNTFYTLDNAFSSSAQVDAAIVACYQHVRWMNQIGGKTSWIMGNGLGTDALDVPELRIGTTFSDYSRLNPDSGEYNDVYSRLYQLVSKANTALYGLGLEHITWQSEQEKNYAEAQARFFRGYAYRSLGNFFGGVPIVENIITAPKLDFVRSTVMETYQFAIDDMEFALNHFPETHASDGRLVKGAAQHYLAELYTAMGIEFEEQGQSGDAMYNVALQYANDLIDGGIYSLMTERFGARMDETPSTPPFWNPETADVYWDLFQEGNVSYNDGNTESIWVFVIDFAAYMAEDGQSRIQYPRSFVPVLRFIDGFEGVLEDAGGRGICSAAPTMHVRDGVWEGSLWDDTRNAEHNHRRTFYYNNPEHPEYGEVIPYSVLYADDFLRSICYPIHMKITTDKFTGIEQGENRSHLFRDEYAIRLAETILLRAEIHYRLGNMTEAANDLNLIRDRAQAEYRVSPEDVSLDFILDERIRELYIEEQRWNTLLRMRGTVAVDRIREHAFWPFTETTLTWDFNMFPIPQAQIDRNIDHVMEQNPGWTQF